MVMLYFDKYIPGKSAFITFLSIVSHSASDQLCNIWQSENTSAFGKGLKKSPIVIMLCVCSIYREIRINQILSFV